MNRANQQQIVQIANQQLVAIRGSELQYFSIFFSNFGVNAALMVGFVAGSISQVPGYENPSGTWYGFILVYWFSSALLVCTAAYALLGTQLCDVYGQGLALRGPLGSMVQAIDMMVLEQTVTNQMFIISLFLFGFQQIGMYFIMMESTSGWAASTVTIVAMISWYRYALRLYNKFGLQVENVEWRERERNDMDGLDPFTTMQKQHQKQAILSSSGSMSSTVSGHGMALVNLTEAENEKDNDKHASGYLTLRVPSSIFGGDPWKRRYFLVRGRMIYFFKDKRAFEREPTKPINHRGIDLEGYTLIAGAKEPPYSISLVPIDPEDGRKAWKMRCDTLRELNKWAELFTDALKECDSWNKHGGLVDIADQGALDDEDDE